MIYELDGPGGAIIDDGYLDKTTGVLILAINFTGYADGVYTVTASQMSTAGNISAVSLSTPTLTLDTVTPTGSFTVNGAPSNTALTNNPTVALALSFTDDRAGVYLSRVSVDGGTTWSAWTSYVSAVSLTLPSPDGTYTVAVMVADKAGNTVVATQRVILDRTGPAITAALSTPNNGTYYDVGSPVVLTWSATDAHGLGTSSASIEGQTISASGGSIDIDSLIAGTHTVTVTQRDALGNVSTKAISFTIRATAKGILNAINDGAARGFMTAAEKTTLTNAINNVINANGGGAPTKMRGFISQLQSATAAQLNAAYKTLLLNWANDAYSRM